MLLFEQQQFEFLLQSAVERFVERSEQRFQGAERALEQWRQDPKMLSKWLSGFCDAVFEDFLLNNVDGACFVLRAMSKHKVAEAAEEVPVGRPRQVTWNRICASLPSGCSGDCFTEKRWKLSKCTLVINLLLSKVRAVSISNQEASKTSLPSLTNDDFEQLAQKVDQAMAEVQAMPPEMRGKATALKSAIEEFHKVGLTQIVRAMKYDEHGKEIFTDWWKILPYTRSFRCMA